MGRAAGTLVASLLSGVAWVASHLIYGVLKVWYHRDVKILLMFVAGGLAIAAVVHWLL